MRARAGSPPAATSDRIPPGALTTALSAVLNLQLLRDMHHAALPGLSPRKAVYDFLVALAARDAASTSFLARRPRFWYRHPRKAVLKESATDTFCRQNVRILFLFTQVEFVAMAATLRAERKIGITRKLPRIRVFDETSTWPRRDFSRSPFA
jgi:hypothetical protein